MAIQHLQGLNIYQDEKGRDIYYDRFITKKAYLVPPHQAHRFNLFQFRYTLPIIIFILLSTWIGSILALLIAAAVFIFLEVLFRVRFLPQLSIAKRFKPTPKEPFLKRLERNDPKNKLFLKAGLFAAFAILLVLNVHYSNIDDSFSILAQYILSVGSLIMSGLYLWIAIRKN